MDDRSDERPATALTGRREQPALHRNASARLRRPPAPLLLAVDIEPDDHLLRRDGSSPITGFPLLFREMTNLRRRVEDLTGRRVRFSWFVRFDPQMELAFGSSAHLVHRFESEFGELIAAGDEIGVHTHYWRWDPVRDSWRVEHGDPAWVEHCLESSLDAYESTFGHGCASHRCGDRFMSQQIVCVLQRRGARYDLTVEPGERAVATLHRGAPFSGSIPDYEHVPHTPYRPSPEDFRRPATGPAGPTGALQMVPLTAVETAAPKVRRARTLVGRPPLRLRPHSLWRAGSEPAEYWDMADRRRRQIAEPYLAFAMRTDSLVLPEIAARVAPRLRALAAHRVAKTSWFTTPSGWLGSGST